MKVVMPRCSSSQTTRASRSSLVVVLAATVVALRLYSPETSVAFHLVAPVARETAPDRTQQIDVEETADSLLDEFKKRSKESDPSNFNITLQLGSGIPNIDINEVMSGYPWATCFAQHRSDRINGQSGTMEHLSVVEKWVMHGDNVDTFKSWKQGTEKPVSVRCSMANLESALADACMECVPLHTGFFGSNAGGDVQSPVAGCITNGFCKSGTVSMPL